MTTDPFLLLFLRYGSWGSLPPAIPENKMTKIYLKTLIKQLDGVVAIT